MWCALSTAELLSLCAKKKLSLVAEADTGTAGWSFSTNAWPSVFSPALATRCDADRNDDDAVDASARTDVTAPPGKAWSWNMVTPTNISNATQMNVCREHMPRRAQVAMGRADGVVNSWREI
jgi:hypothetical protein